MLSVSTGHGRVLRARWHVQKARRVKPGFPSCNRSFHPHGVFREARGSEVLRRCAAWYASMCQMILILNVTERGLHS